MSVNDIFYTIRSLKDGALKEFLTVPDHLHEIRKWRLSDKLGHTTDQSLRESFEFEGHQTQEMPTNAVLDWLWHVYKKEL